MVTNFTSFFKIYFVTLNRHSPTMRGSSWFPLEIVQYFDLRPGPKMLFQGDAPEGSDTFQWPVIERDRVGGLRLIIWDKVKVPLCHYRVMHRKRVASKLHDSYFRLMTIKHSISKIEWASNDYKTQLEFRPVASWVEFESQWQLRPVELQ